ncbi:MAG: DsbC family protein [Candidatus Berkiellales bacterium]
MYKILQVGLISLSLAMCSVANAAPDDTASLKAMLKDNFPELTIDEVTSSPINGIYQVSTGGSILYVTKDGHYALSGDIIDLKNGQKNITEAARKTARLAGLKSIGEENMITFAPKDPKYTVTVFTDVDCAYCRKLQDEMSAINAKGIAVRYLAFPRSGPNSPTFEKMLEIWCAKDRQKAFAAASHQSSEAKGKACSDQSVLREFQFGLSLGVNGTPTIIFEDGTLFPGYLPADKLLEVVKEIRQDNQGGKA